MALPTVLSLGLSISSLQLVLTKWLPPNLVQLSSLQYFKVGSSGKLGYLSDLAAVIVDQRRFHYAMAWITNLCSAVIRRRYVLAPLGGVPS